VGETILTTRTWRAWGALGGLLFVVLFVVGNRLSVLPSSDASPGRYQAYFGSSDHRAKIGLVWFIESLGLFFFLWFVASLRETVRGADRERPNADGSMFATVVLVGGALFGALLLAAIGLADGVRTMSTDSYHHQVYPGIIQGVDDGAYAILRTSSFPLAAMIVAFSLAALRSRVLPAWTGWFGFLAGAAAVASMFVPRVGYLWLLWVAIVSGLLFVSSDAEWSNRPLLKLRPATSDP
jgi:hypothetical protein